MARQNFVGFVISQGKMNKTVKVRVMQKVYNKQLYKEYLKKKDFLVHDEANICKEGDFVRIEATRPLSARKFFSVAEIKRNKGQEFQVYQEEAKKSVAEEEAARRTDLLNRRKLYDSNDSTLYNDLSEVKMLRKPVEELTNEEREKIASLKEKYGITNWDKDFEDRELFLSDLSYLAGKLEKMRLDIKLTEKVNKLLADQESEAFKKIVEQLQLDPATKKNIVKNKVRKFLESIPVEELGKMGIHL
ncbi:hypothetical protein OGAPHI_000357 [Ogataea philodendri]|uniref:37S ribosomal protein S17, mitochondrial n=1 Tax=Ogataea philodendri TaxID=1378263 RepID=A0A9P8PI18_9ASCO|nr:uncharacterized protein OGAPHI_000357 [Ogataea philodendri]KAH3671652.1 hypothetical protein OGAPHI_000357 [Ogataea philodendri]